MYIDEEKRQIRQKQMQNKNNSMYKSKLSFIFLDAQEGGMREHEYLEEEFIDIPVDPLVEDVTDLLEIYAKACQYAEISKQWNQLENILRSVWN